MKIFSTPGSTTTRTTTDAVTTKVNKRQPRSTNVNQGQQTPTKVNKRQLKSSSPAMPDTEDAAFRTDRSNKKRKVTSSIRAVERYLSDGEERSVIEDKSRQLKAAFNDFLETHDAYMDTLKTERELEEGEAYLNEVNKRHVEIFDLAKVETTNSDAVSVEKEKEEHYKLMNLPKATLVSFDGDPP